MRRFLATFFACLMASGMALSAEIAPPSARAPLPVQFDGAGWIWFTPDAKTSAGNFPEGIVHFRTAFVLPEQASIQAAEVAVTADNLYTLHVNGSVAGESVTDPDAWHLPGRFDVARRLRP